MSELKAFDIVVAEEGYCEGFVTYRRAVYDKSEVDKVIAHHKHKRCLAMAMWCDSEMNYWYDRIEMEQCQRFRYYNKWHNRWTILAKKFKEAK